MPPKNKHNMAVLLDGTEIDWQAKELIFAATNSATWEMAEPIIIQMKPSWEAWYAITKESRNNWRKMHGLPMRSRHIYKARGIRATIAKL